MKRTTEIAWKTDDGETLLHYCGDPESIQVIPASCNRSKLRELGDAIADALGRAWEPPAQKDEET